MIFFIIMDKIIDQNLLESLLSQAKENQRLRVSHDLRTSPEEQSQRMLNALMPGTAVAIHRHPNSTEDVLCLHGRLDEIFYNNEGKEIERVQLCPSEGKLGCVVPKGVWHSIEVYEPSVIYEGKGCKYGEDGSEILKVND